MTASDDDIQDRSEESNTETDHTQQGTHMTSECTVGNEERSDNRQTASNDDIQDRSEESISNEHYREIEMVTTLQEETPNDQQTTEKREHRPTDVKLQINPNCEIEGRDLKTKQASCVAKIIGKTEKVVEFDKLRLQIKSGQKPTQAQKLSHNKLLAELQSLVMLKKRKVELEIQHTEKSYFEKHATLPVADSCPELLELMKSTSLSINC